MTGRFQNFVAIDWSGAKGPRQKGIAIAQCQPGNSAPTLVRPKHRWSRQEVLEWLLTELPPESIVGFDLSPGLPFDDHKAFFPEWTETPATAKALWQKVDALAGDDPHLSATSVVRHPELRRHFLHGKDDRGDLFESPKGRLRETEKRQKGQQLTPSSCFNLVGPAQVGKSSLTGMRVLHRLNGSISVWPFDPRRTEGSVVVEIYTTIAALAAGRSASKSKIRDYSDLKSALAKLGSACPLGSGKISDHDSDALITAAWLRTAAQDPALWNPPGLAAVAQTEGWTFGVL